VIGPLVFSLVGILSRISTVLAEAGISIFAISTYDTVSHALLDPHHKHIHIVTSPPPSPPFTVVLFKPPPYLHPPETTHRITFWSRKTRWTWRSLPSVL
jgi:hypothetical protein